MNPLTRLTHLITRYRTRKQLKAWWAGIEANLAARRAARASGQTYVSGHVRRAKAGVVIPWAKS